MVSHFFILQLITTQKWKMASNCEMTDRNVQKMWRNVKSWQKISSTRKPTHTRDYMCSHTSTNGIGTFFNEIAFLAFVRHLSQMVCNGGVYIESVVAFRTTVVRYRFTQLLDFKCKMLLYLLVLLLLWFCSRYTVVNSRSTSFILLTIFISSFSQTVIGLCSSFSLRLPCCLPFACRNPPVSQSFDRSNVCCSFVFTLICTLAFTNGFYANPHIRFRFLEHKLHRTTKMRWKKPRCNFFSRSLKKAPTSSQYGICVSVDIIGVCVCVCVCVWLIFRFYCKLNMPIC